MVRASSCIIVLGLTAFGSAAADSIKERVLTLQFVPQEATGSSSPTISEAMASRPAHLMFEDKRPPAEVESVGEGTDDDDHPFPWRSTAPVADFARDVFVRTAQGWGVRLEEDADLLLAVRLTRFFVSEKDQAVGSSYSSDVRVVFELKGRDGSLLNSGVASGSARRYGKKRSAENCNEVLSDAMKEAYANLFNQANLQTAWAGKPPGSSSASQAISPGALLAEIVGLKRQGFSAELLIRYINQKTLTAPMSAQDLAQWKSAEMPEAVIQAAMDRPLASN